ncbi:MAG: nuclear transport factor 2 family protein [Acidobacteria bacterium]|nr:nuclear transport factor 2 family protein [Acidobacteriota bacterium]
MSITKSLSGSGDNRKQPNTGRRSFIWKAGAAMSAVVASAATGFSKTGVDRADALKDANAVRTLHRTYESRLNKGMYEEVVGMFANNAEVVFNGGLFKGEKSIRRLYCEFFQAGQTGKKIEPAPGFEPDPEQPQDIVDVAADRKTATGQFPYSMQVGTPMTEDTSLVKMARLQGEGIVKWWEGGTHEVTCVKVGESWKIRRLEYRLVSKADYRPGRTHARAIDIPAFSKVYPADPAGPDKLV